MKYKKARKDFRIRVNKFNKMTTVFLLRILRSNSQLMHYQSYQFFNKIFYKTRSKTTNNICFLTGKARGVISKFRLVRHEYKRLANSGLLYGVSKASF